MALCGGRGGTGGEAAVTQALTRVCSSSAVEEDGGGEGMWRRRERGREVGDELREMMASNSVRTFYFLCMSGTSGGGQGKRTHLVRDARDGVGGRLGAAGGVARLCLKR